MQFKISSILVVLSFIFLVSCSSESDADKINSEDLALFNKGYDVLTQWKENVKETSIREAIVFYDSFVGDLLAPVAGSQRAKDPEEIGPLVNDIGYESSNQLHEWMVDFGLNVYRQTRDDRYDTIDQYLEALVFVGLNTRQNLSACESEVMVSFLRKAVNRGTSYGLNTVNPNNRPAAFELIDDSFLVGSTIHKVLLSIRDIKGCN